MCRKEETFNYNQTFQVLSDVCLTQTFTYIKTSQHFLTPTLMMSGFNWWLQTVIASNSHLTCRSWLASMDSGWQGWDASEGVSPSINCALYLLKVCTKPRASFSYKKRHCDWNKTLTERQGDLHLTSACCLFQFRPDLKDHSEQQFDLRH